MANFDVTKLDSRQYTLGVPTDAILLQNTIEDFVNVVRTNPRYVGANPHLINQFCALIDDDKAFPLARRVVPELRYSQAYDTTKNTVINIILRAPGIKRRRPMPPVDDDTNVAERGVIRRQTRAMVMYLEYDRGREQAATEQQQQDSGEIVERGLEIIMPE